MNKAEYKYIELMIVGSQKSGTSSLLRYLAQHPEIDTHPQPEMTFFLQDHEYRKGYEWAYTKYFSDSSEELHLIAKNVMVMGSTERMKRIYEHNPEIHLVVLLREPVARAYSAYWWARRRGWENLKSFEDALDAEDTRLKDDWFKWRQCLYKFNSTYYPLVNNMITLFGEEKVHCFLTDDLKTDAVSMCQTLFELIGVSTDFQPKVEQRYNEAAMPKSEKFGFFFTQFLASRNPLRRAIRKLISDKAAYKLRNAVLDMNEKPFTPPPLNPNTRQQLVNHFKSYNDQLVTLIKRDLSHWNTRK